LSLRCTSLMQVFLGTLGAWLTTYPTTESRALALRKQLPLQNTPSCSTSQHILQRSFSNQSTHSQQNQLSWPPSKLEIPCPKASSSSKLSSTPLSSTALQRSNTTITDGLPLPTLTRPPAAVPKPTTPAKSGQTRKLSSSPSPAPSLPGK
jgi:hypothetical protein